MHERRLCVRRRTVSPIRQKIALLISNTNLDDLRFAWFQRLSITIDRFFEISDDYDIVGRPEKDRQHDLRSHPFPAFSPEPLQFTLDH